MSETAEHVVVSGGFDDIRCDDIRFLQEAGRLGSLHILLWSDERVRAATGRKPKFPESERLYFLQAVRYVHDIHLIDGPADPHALPAAPIPQPWVWVVRSDDDSPGKRAFCNAGGLEYRVLADQDLAGFPCDVAAASGSPERKKVLVTGCYDWFHSGHVRFFEEVSELGDLYVVVGHDANIRLLKGDGHPMFNQDQRRYIVGSIRYVTQALISSGHGWLDAEPEIERICPDIYAVNEDGDKPEKRQYCEKHGIEYAVLKRLPRPGLPKRQSTNLRGF
ncbi:MAG: adenylyltransferase/cytidyltransferase family protein [Phycisphaerales bacterium]